MKSFQWEKKGLIVTPNYFKLNWWKSYGMDPCSIHLRGNVYRIFFCGRNKDNVSQIGYVDYDLEKFKAIGISKKPVLVQGKLGCFDDNGVTASCAVKVKKKIYLYYIGWKPKSTTRYSLMTGLAISNNNGKNFYRFSKAPILNLTNREPYSILTAPYVLKLKSKWMMWYVSCERWENENYPVYNIKIATSSNGIDWKQDGKVCINLKKNERAVARPYVYYENKVYKMFYCFEKSVGDYKIGYAESIDGLKWNRKDDIVGITTSRNKNDWDHKMIAYPHLIFHKKKKYMLYNGNSYGIDGFGLAVENK